MRWSLETAAELCEGTPFGAATIRSVVVDSRDAVAGALFVALRGDRSDGHEFVSDALERGAPAVLCERGRLPAGVCGLEVDDPLEALRLLAIGRRKELQVPVVAITGSSGKTTTKDLIAAILGPTAHAAPRSFNNEIGVPLTVLSCPDDAGAMVIEVGSRGPGHIGHLAEAVRPDVAVVTNVGRAHLETFGSIEGVLEAKWELVDALLPSGTAVLPADDDRLVGRVAGAMLSFGEDAGADVDARNVTLDVRGVAGFDLWHGDSSVSVVLAVPGRHQPRNAAAAVAAAVALGRPFAESAHRLAEARVSPWRMELFEVPCSDGSVTVLNDSYNANPDSMHAAFETAVAIPGRRFVVLGKMHELGASEAAAHREVGKRAADLGFHVVTVGDDPGFAAGAGDETVSVADADRAVEHLRGVLRPGDVVLIKGSRAAGLELVAQGLEEVLT